MVERERERENKTHNVIVMGKESVDIPHSSLSFKQLRKGHNKQNTLMAARARWQYISFRHIPPSCHSNDSLTVVPLQAWMRVATRTAAAVSQKRDFPL